MSERVFRKLGTGYEMSLPDLGTTFVADRLRRVGGELHADVVVRSRWPGARTYDGIMHASRFNLTAPTTRKAVSKLLAERAPAEEGQELDWYGFLEEFCQRILAQEREGLPFLDIGTRPRRISPGMLVDPLLPARKVTILFGDGGTGKSFLALGIGLSVVTGEQIVPGFRPISTGPVIYLDWETDDEDIEDRVRAVCLGAGIAPVTIRYRSVARILADQIEEICREVDELGATMVIVDSVGLAAGTGSEGSDAAESALRFFGALGLIRERGATPLCVDHVAKAAAGLVGGAGKPYGSTYKTNLARATWELRQARGMTGDGTVHLGLYHRKANTMARHSAIGLAMEFGNDGGVRWRREEITDEDLTGSLTQAEQIARVLIHPMRVKEIAVETGIAERQVAAVLAKGKGRMFVNLGVTGWAKVAGDA